MVFLAPQFVTILAAISASGVSAAVLPRRNLDRLQAQVHVDPHAQAYLGRRSVPVAPLPATVIAKMQQTSNDHHVPGAHHGTDPSKSSSKKDDKKKDKKKKDRSVAQRREDSMQAKVPQVGVSGTSDKTLPQAPAANKRDHKHHGHHHHHHHHSHHDKKRSTTVEPSDAPSQKLMLRGVEVRRKRNHDHHSRTGPHRQDSDKVKRTVVHIGPSSGGRTPSNADILHLEIGKRRDGAQETETKRSLPLARNGSLASSLGYLLGLATRSTKHEARDPSHHHHHHHHHNHHHHEHHRRDVPEGVEGVISIVSATSGTTAGETIASLLLSQDPATSNAFVLNASNSSATHVYMVPANTTSVQSASAGGTMPVNLHVPVFSPDEAEMLSYCMQYDPNPPAPAPLTAQECNSTVTDHASQIFSYDPATGHIVPMWTVSPSSTDPSAQSSETNSTTTASMISDTATSSMLPTSTADSTTTSSSVSATSSAAPAKRTAAAYIVEDDSNAPQDTPCDTPSGAVDDAAAGPQVAAAGTSAGSGMTPQDVTLIFTPSDAAGILPSNVGSKSPAISPATSTSGSSNDGNVGGGPASAASTTDDGEDDGDDDGEDEDEGGADDDSADGADDADSKDDADAGSGGSVPANAAMSPSVDNAEDVFSADDVTEVTASASGAPSPSMTPVASASAPYSWMFSPQQ